MAARGNLTGSGERMDDVDKQCYRTGLRYQPHGVQAALPCHGKSSLCWETAGHSAMRERESLRCWQDRAGALRDNN